LAHAFWPGPLTLVVPRVDGSPVASLATAGLGSIGLRFPKGPAATLIGMLGHPLAAPSANSSGRISPTTARSVLDDLGDKLPLVLDGGPCPVGLESTIIKVDGEQVRLLRPGAITAEAIEAVLGLPVERIDQRAAIEAPGMLQSHYAPKARVRLNAMSVRTGEALLAFGARRAQGAEHASAMLNLSESGNLNEAAANLFGHLSELDKCNSAMIAVEPIPDEGLGEAINDRLRRAAAPRDHGNA
jgi:L-threonylcarbamoyladenylate synthase